MTGAPATLSAQRAWNERSALSDVVRELEHELNVSALGARLLALRGVQGGDIARSFLARRLADLHRPDQMADLPVAARRLARAINQRERILIHGDYDVDGSTSAALLAQFIGLCSHRAQVWIPHRRIDGYGLSDSSLEEAIQQRAQLMVTVDCGIADRGFAARIEAEAHCDVIITDHHLPQRDLPRCTAVCNPNRPDCSYPDKALAGVGVAWKLAWATALVLSGSDGTGGDGKVTPVLRQFLLDALALVAVGTVADCAAMTGENRILVHHGLRALARTTSPGLRALLTQARLDGPISASDIGWRIGPLLNASGRVGSALATVRLLTATTASEAAEALAVVVAENDERKRITHQLSTDLLAAAAQPEHSARRSLVFAGEGWHPGVVGIVASRLTEAYAKPSVVIAINDGLGKGSLRTVAGVHLGEVIDACRGLLRSGGGHAMAAGLTIDPVHLDAFRAAFETEVLTRRPGPPTPPSTLHDGNVGIAELDGDFYALLAALGPFGIGNPEPVLHLTSAVFLSRPRLFGATGDHLRGALSDRGGGMKEIMVWKARDLIPALTHAGARFDLLVRPEVSQWRGEELHRLVYVDGKSAS